MQFSELWLREWVNPALSIEDLGHRITMAGLEVDSVTPVAAAFTGVVIGEVLAVEPHPDADKLRVTRVSIGQGEPLQIVCGAANVRPGLRVPVATVGAELPNGLRIKQAKLRGVESSGMLCAEAELGLADTSDGLWELPADAPVGQDIRQWLLLDDRMIELGLTPNRGDCLGMLGLAREVAAVTGAPMQVPALVTVAAQIPDQLPVSLDAAAACPRYAGRIIRGIRPDAVTPLWLVERLRRSGIRAISPVVDITNYVLIELGQPMHAFDLAKVGGGIRVRQAIAGEQLELLDGQTVTLRDDTLVIADAHQALALAGIMGGQGSAVGDSTTDIFLESAFFAPLAVAGKARSYGLHTDSSHRFERGVDPTVQDCALERAAELVLAICGGQAGPVTLVEARAELPPQAVIPLRRQRIERLLGFQLADGTVVDMLTRLGMQCAPSAEGWQVTAPSWRFDIAIEADLIEELARLHGYDNIPVRRPQGEVALKPQAEDSLSVGRLKRLLVDQGYQEAITFSFVEPSLQQKLDPAVTPLALANPIAADLAVMRSTLWAGLLRAVAYNQNRQQPRVRLFETGLRFVPGPDGLKQEPMLAFVATGDLLPELWSHSRKPLDFFDIKGNLEALLALAGASDRVGFKAAEHPALHSGQSAALIRGMQTVGWMGRLHPQLEKSLSLQGPVYLVEVELAVLTGGTLPRFRELSRFPEVRRDIAVVVDRRQAGAELLQVVREAAGSELRDVCLFDVYEGQGVPDSKRSLAIAMTWQHAERTLLDEEIQSRVDAVVDTLKARFDAILRD